MSSNGIMLAAAMNSFGSPEVLVVQDVWRPKAGAGQVLVRNYAAGVNYADLVVRSGEMTKGVKLPKNLRPALPFIPGLEGAGVIEDVGEGVTHLKAGQRVLWLGFLGAGGYGEFSTIDARFVVPIADHVSFEDAAAAPAVYATAHNIYKLMPRTSAAPWVLIRAAAGGAGSALLQVAKARGYKTIAVCSAKKLAYARAQGATAVVDREDDVSARVRELTDGAGIAFAANPVAGSTIVEDMDLLQHGGQLSVFGFLDGPPRGDIASAMLRGFSRAIGIHFSEVYSDYFHDSAAMSATLSAIAAGLADGGINSKAAHVRPFSEAAQMHDDIDNGKTHGKCVLTF